MGVTVTGNFLPVQRGAIVYSANQLATSYRGKHALAIAGRTEYGQAWVKPASEAGTVVIFYVDFTIYANSGLAHNLFFNAGTVNGHSYAAIGTFNRGGTSWPAVNIYTAVDYEAKAYDVLKTVMVAYPWCRGFFADDAGPNWGGYNNPSSLYGTTYGGQAQCTAADKTQARVYQLGIARAYRRIADEYGILIIHNAEWRADTGSGYPVTSQHGCSLYDGVTNESHAPDTYWLAVMSGQERLRDSAGNRANFSIVSPGGVAAWLGRSQNAWITDQSPGPYNGLPSANLASIHDAGIVYGSNPPTTTVAVTPTTIDLQVGTQQQFTATITPSGTIRFWQVNGFVQGTTATGIVTQGGLYTAPATVPSPATVRVEALLTTGEIGAANVTIIDAAPPPAVLLGPPPAAVHTVFGNRFAGSIANDLTPDYARGVIVTCTTAGNLDFLSVGLDAGGPGTANQPIKLYLYAVDANNIVGGWIATSAEYTIVDGLVAAWIPLTFAARPLLAVDTNYLAVIHSGGTEATGRIFREETAGVSRGVAGAYASGAPSFAVSSTGNADISIYGDLTPTGSGGVTLEADSFGSSQTAADLTSIVSSPGIPADEVGTVLVPTLVTRQIPWNYHFDPVTGERGEQVQFNPLTLEWETVPAP